ncbi:MAG: hypothetical protein WDM92_13945 [Caulobacteraceae bacterium]
MTEIFEGLIPSPQAWTGAELGGKGPLVRPVDRQALAGFDALAARLRAGRCRRSAARTSTTRR